MNNQEILIKLSYVTGLRSVVFNEINQCNITILSEIEDSFFIAYAPEILEGVKKMRSITRAYVVLRGKNHTPLYISNHKSLLGDLVSLVVSDSSDFSSYAITCAGQNSPEVQGISRYIQDEYRLPEAQEADLKIHIIKVKDIWEVGVQISPRPLSVREYRAVHMSGAMDPTVAYAMNSFCNLQKATSYLNVFCGSSTLLIEAALCYPNLEKVMGFDNDKTHLSLSMQNIQKAGLVRKVMLKQADIYDEPDFGKFDAIVSDLPFGMVISKNTNINELYESFISYCEKYLEPSGRLVMYTSQYDILEPIVSRSQFEIVESLQLKSITKVGAYLQTKIFVCKFKAG